MDELIAGFIPINQVDIRKIYLIFLMIGSGLLTNCRQSSRKNKGATFSDSKKQSITTHDALNGKLLSQIYCVRCHAYPSPRLLDKETWVKQTLPNMGPRLGIFKHNGVTYPIEKTANLPEDIYPDTALISEKNWQKIVNYYKETAPKELKPAKRDKKIIVNSLFFKAYAPPIYPAQGPPMVTAIRFDPGNKVIYLSNASNNKFLIFNDKLELSDQLNITSPISDIHILNNRDKPGNRNLLLTYIGNLYPSDALKGSVMKSSYNPKTKEANVGNMVTNHVERPVESQQADLDQDGKKDILINEFGHRKGHLFWLKNMGRGKKPEKKVLTDIPGCIKSEVKDLNKDGLPDIIALCTQSDEAIYLFENQGNGKFSEHILLQFQVVAGSSSFEMDDFNNDGKLDILYTSGDNADYSTIYKPYHGVYIYLNKGNRNFKKAWFYPMNGAYNAKARDFDHDGDLDIASISFFADYRNMPQEGFIFFKNEGDLSFTPYHPPATSNGRWITMDIADWTGNGYDDILLGNFSIGPTKVIPKIQHKFTHSPEFLLLENNANSKK